MTALNQSRIIRNCAVSAFFLILFSFILYKAVHLPITHDEFASSVYYPAFGVWEIMMYPDYWPNNHILNTLLVKLSESVFGIEPWSVRLPNLLAFIFFFAVMYAAAVRYFAASFFFFSFLLRLCFAIHSY